MRIDNALAQISKHKQLIIVVIGVAAIASYMIPFANLFAVADATSGGWWNWKQKKVDFKHDDKKKKFDFKFAKFFQKFFIKNLFIDKSVRNTITQNGIDIFGSFNNVGTITNTAATGGLALNQGSTYFIIQIQNCQSAASSGHNSFSDTVSSNSCSQTATQNIQNNNPSAYVQFGGRV